MRDAAEVRSMSGDDWRLTSQETYLKSATLVWAAYTPHSDRWTHDHCEFCWERFSLREGDLHAGYCTRDRYRWVCPACYEDFRERFGFTLADGDE